MLDQSSRFPVFIFVIFLLLPVVPAHAECRAVARAYGETICREALANHGADAVLALRDEIWQRALRHVYGAEKLTPQEKDVQAYISARRDYLAHNHAQELKIADILSAAIADKNLSAADEEKARDVLASVQQSMKLYEARKNQSAPHGAAPDIERQVAVAEISAWMGDALLFKTYGGSLSMREGRPVPADAYRKFAGMIADDPAFEITDDDFKNVLAGDLVPPREGQMGNQEIPAVEFYADPLFLLRAGDGGIDAQGVKDWVKQVQIKPQPAE